MTLMKNRQQFRHTRKSRYLVTVRFQSHSIQAFAGMIKAQMNNTFYKQPDWHPH